LSELVILGRDGVINRYQGQAITCAADWEPTPGSLEAIASLTQAGYRVAVATNQPGLARGLFDLDALNAIHHKLHQQLDRLGGHVDVIAYCPHSPSQGCECHKPATGMYQRIAERFGVAPSSLIVIGASDADHQVAQALGAQSLLIRSARCHLQAGGDGPALFDDLSAAVGALLADD
jgi:D-glycero-D-manno-heptose 1,7-bisphosphate phosphatase